MTIHWCQIVITLEMCWYGLCVWLILIDVQVPEEKPLGVLSFSVRKSRTSSQIEPLIIWLITGLFNVGVLAGMDDYLLKLGGGGEFLAILPIRTYIFLYVEMVLWRAWQHCMPRKHIWGFYLTPNHRPQSGTNVWRQTVAKHANH